MGRAWRPIPTARRALKSPSMRLFPLLLCLSAAAVAQDEPAPGGRGPQEPINATTFAGLRVRNIGPTFISGRVSQIAVFPDNSSHYLVAEASGGIWLTSFNTKLHGNFLYHDAGGTWSRVPVPGISRKTGYKLLGHSNIAGSRR